MSLLTRRAALVGAAVLLSTKARSGSSVSHIVLLGDSVIDNNAYVGGGPDVAAQLDTVLSGGKVTCLARDGAVIAEVISQLVQVPKDATHLVISAGGNDALQQSHFLHEAASSVEQVLRKFSEIQAGFRQQYRQMLDLAHKQRLPVAVYTVYDPRFQDPTQRLIASVALSVINDVITREVFSRGLDLIDLRVLFNEDRDFANAIEPSVQGGMKLAEAIRHFSSGQAEARVFGRLRGL
jgi:hypothetical protein